MVKTYHGDGSAVPEKGEHTWQTRLLNALFGALSGSILGGVFTFFGMPAIWIILFAIVTAVALSFFAQDWD